MDAGATVAIYIPGFCWDVTSAAVNKELHDANVRTVSDLRSNNASARQL